VPLEEAQAALKAVGARAFVRLVLFILRARPSDAACSACSADGAEALSFEQFARWWHSAKASPAPADAAQRVAEPPGGAA
jgi:hypothetical protein